MKIIEENSQKIVLDLTDSASVHAYYMYLISKEKEYGVDRLCPYDIETVEHSLYGQIVFRLSPYWKSN